MCSCKANSWFTAFHWASVCEGMTHPTASHSQISLSATKMSRRVALAVVVLAFAGGWCPCLADVGDFAPCLHVFYKSWPPKGLAGTPICQRYDNQYHFATLYSRPRRSPWFSAYLYSVPAGKRPSASWKFEPQVRLFKYCVVWLEDLKTWIYTERRWKVGNLLYVYTEITRCNLIYLIFWLIKCVLLISLSLNCCNTIHTQYIF